MTLSTCRRASHVETAPPQLLHVLLDLTSSLLVEFSHKPETMEYEDERSEYNTSEVDWGQESNPSWSGEEDYDYGSWEGETDSEISLEEVDERDEEPWYEETNSDGAFEGEEGQVDDEIEPEPPDHSQDDESHKSWCGAETNQEESEGEGCEGDSWRGETESQFSLEEDLPNGETQISHGDEGFNHHREPDQFIESYTQERPWCEIPYSDQEEDRQEETDSQISLREDESHGVETWSHEGESNYGDESDRGEEETDHTKDQPTLWGDEEDYEPQYLTFSGYSQGTEDYLRWEEDMEACFQSCQVPEEEQLSYALDTLTGPAYEWWEQEENARVKYNEPAHTWGSFKLEIYEEFVKEAAAQHQQDMPSYSYTKPRRWILATTPRVKATPRKTCSPKPNKTFSPILEEKGEAKLPTRVKAEPPKSISQAITYKSSTKSLLKLQRTGTQGQTKEHEAEDVEGGISIEKPPAAQQPVQTRGESVLRSKLFQGRGYDAVITPETEPKLIQIGCTMRIRPEKDIRSLCEPYQLNNKDSRQETTWKIVSAHLYNPSKKNQPKRSSHEGVIQFTNRMIPSLPDLDIYGFIEAFQPDQKDLSYESYEFSVLELLNRKHYLSLRDPVEVPVLIPDVILGSLDHEAKEQLEPEELLDQSVYQSIEQAIEQSIEQAIEHSIDQSLDLLLDQLLDHQSLDQSLDHSIDHAGEDSMKLETDDSIDHSTKHSTKCEDGELGAEENVTLYLSNGPVTRSKTKLLNQAITTLLQQIEGSLEHGACPTALVMIQAVQVITMEVDMVNAKEGENCSKLVLEALTATMTKMLDERFEVYQKRKEQELKPKPPDNSLRSTRSSLQKNSYTSKSKSVLYCDSQLATELYKFSGKRDYLEWEKNMDEWFYYHNFLSEKRLACAISQLTGDAYKWWVQEVDDRWYYKEPPITSWRDLKKLLRNKYAPQAPNRTPPTNATAQELAVREKKPISHQYFATKERSDHKKSLAPKEQKESLKNNPIAEEELKNEVLKILNAYNKPKKAKCALSSPSEKAKFPLPSDFVKDTCDLSEKPDFVLENDQACETLIQSEPVHPSSLVSISQVEEEESLEETPRSLPLVSHLEQPPDSAPEPILKTNECQLKHCKEFNLIVLMSDHEEKRFGLEKVKEFRASNSVIDNMITSFESHSSLSISKFSNICEPVRAKSQNVLVRTSCELKNVLKNKSCESNSFIELCNSTDKEHVDKFSTSSIMHLLCPISAQKRTGAMEKHKYLGELTTRKRTFNILHHSHEELRRAEGALNPLTIKEKPPDWHQSPYIRKESKDRYMSKTRDFTKGNSVLMLGQGERLVCSIQIKENPPDALFEQRSIPKVSVYVLKKPFIPSHTAMIRLSLSKEPNAGVKAVLKHMGSTRRRQEDNRFKPPDVHQSNEKREEDNRFKPPDLDQDKHQDLSSYILIKEAPPDGIYKLKLKPRMDRSFQVLQHNNNKDHPTDLQGKYNIGKGFNVTYFVSFDADKTDLRSNLFQLGEDDVILGSLDHEAKEQLEPEELLDQSVYQSIEQAIEQSIEQAIEHSIDQSLDLLLDQLLDHQSLDQSLDHSIDHAGEDSMKLETDDSIDHSTKHSTKCEDGELGAEENVTLYLSNGPVTRSKTKLLNQAITTLLQQIEGSLEHGACPTALVMIQAVQVITMEDVKKLRKSSLDVAGSTTRREGHPGAISEEGQSRHGWLDVTSSWSPPTLYFVLRRGGHLWRHIQDEEYVEPQFDENVLTLEQKVKLDELYKENPTLTRSDLAALIRLNLLSLRAALEGRELTFYEIREAHALEKVIYWVPPSELEGTCNSTFEIYDFEDIHMPCIEDMTSSLHTPFLIDECYDLICESQRLDILRAENVSRDYHELCFDIEYHCALNVHDLEFKFSMPELSRSLLEESYLGVVLDIDKILHETENTEIDYMDGDVVLYEINGDEVDYFVKTSFKPEMDFIFPLDAFDSHSHPTIKEYFKVYAPIIVIVFDVYFISLPCPTLCYLADVFSYTDRRRTKGSLAQPFDSYD
ncbi:hypothetical protein ISN44_As13g008740 [Arabidopsis suecica]|uniref:Uncharacterized protein n=1 Tax=Arabidopsis suecica TaxID=45249 RepID=A0A8T1XWL3_ARASU|nr:hypothetical protein ISN44_As13g008740 [Arabidopsis suecica]